MSRNFNIYTFSAMIKKNLLKSVFSICLLAVCLMPLSAQAAALRGDVDNSGDVTISDVTTLINLLLSNAAEGNEAADCNGDGAVNINDVTTLINYLLSKEWPVIEVYEPQYESFTVGSVTFRMLLVEGGTFMMGGSEDDPRARPWEFPVHEVTLSDYYIGEFEVTQALWRAVMGTSSSNNPSWFTPTNGYTANYQLPAESMTYTQITSFITKLNQKTGKTFRLPTESEWEYAARGGKWSKGYYYIGGDDVDAVAWTSANAGSITHVGGQKAANEIGLYDMGGNVEEWCSDYWSDAYDPAPSTNPTGPTSGTMRVIRGGSWDQAYYVCRASARHDASTGYKSAHTGIRLALSKQ